MIETNFKKFKSYKKKNESFDEKIESEEVIREEPIEENDIVFLLTSHYEGLEIGHSGTVVKKHNGGEAFEVEFFDKNTKETIKVETVDKDDLSKSFE